MTGKSQTDRVQSRKAVFVRCCLNNLAELKGLIKGGEFDAVKEENEYVPDVLSQLIRTAFIPTDGKKFIVTDFSAIEARVLSWLANESWRMESFANGEPPPASSR